MTEQTKGILDRTIANIKKAWLDIATPSYGAKVSETVELTPSLPDNEIDKLKAQMKACLTGLGGEVSARSRAAALGRAYLSLDQQGRKRFLSVLANEFGPDKEKVDTAATALLAASPDERSVKERELHSALEAPRIKLLTQFNDLPEGVKFLVDMRAELLSFLRDDPALKPLETDLKNLLIRWFDVGFLELRRITWESPATVLEKLIAYEAVHAIKSWDDLKNRLDSDRRCFAYFHPRMPEEPLIFVEVALVAGMSGHIKPLLDENAPVMDPEKADTAIFYSISNAQKGLAGISFGNFLIKRVVGQLSRSFPNLKTFATLSPIPGFRKWLDGRLAEGEPKLLLPAERKSLKAVTGSTGAKGGLKTALAQPLWFEDEKVEAALKPILSRLCARYLMKEKGRGGRALDPVSHFHLTNGARMERLNWLGDPSENGLLQSAGMMINYRYRLNEIESNHEAYSGKGEVKASTSFKGLL